MDAFVHAAGRRRPGSTDEVDAYVTRLLNQMGNAFPDALTTGWDYPYPEAVHHAHHLHHQPPLPLHPDDHPDDPPDGDESDDQPNNPSTDSTQGSEGG